MPFTLTSAAFEEGQPIPQQYTGEGKNQSPPLKWSEPPADTKAFALVCDDPDAPRGTFTHWVLFNLPAELRELSTGLPKEKTLANAAAQGTNSFSRIGYDGPKPPAGKPHRYFFKLYALGQAPTLAAGASKEQLLEAIKGQVLGEAQLMGTYVHGQGR
jgi:Raf kinase inhibitor-like YbhB/YbcL family protein